jgi:hypothetical protein
MATDRRYAEHYGHDPVEVLVTIDEEGSFYGWLKPGDAEPCMIQPWKGLFDMQFPYTPEAEVARGRGRILRLTVEAIGG